MTTARTHHYAGLDGLRALAVALVVVYHLFPGAGLHSGFIGVDVFFVISGFLITSLLLREYRGSGRIALRHFWARRARRLVPALVIVVTVCASIAGLVGGDVLTDLGWQVLGAATFSFNWISMATGAQYFTATSPELFRNLWSLAVEEQFYLLWPLVLPLMLLVRRATLRAVLAIVGAAASAVWMTVLLAQGGELTRVYFGTDTHAFGLLLGVALAFALEAPPRAWMSHRALRPVSLAVGLGALAVLIVIATVPESAEPGVFPAVLASASVLTVVAILAGVWPRSWFGRAVDVAPLRWLGSRSYAVYLWHWPLMILLTAGAGPEGGIPVGIGILTLVLTLALSELSYRFVEMPIRTRGFRGTARAWAGAVRGPSGRRATALGAAALGVLLVGGTTAAMAAAPTQTAAEKAVQDGADAVAAAPSASAPPPSPSSFATADAPERDGIPVPTPSPTEVAGAEITAVGDSVMLASAPALFEGLPGIAVDAEVSRSMYAGPGILESLAAQNAMRTYVVVALGTNGPIERSTLDRLADIVGPDRTLVLVTAYAPRSWIDGVNAELEAFASSHSNVEIADWHDAIATHTDLLAGDDIHPSSGGGAVFTTAVENAVQRAEERRAHEQWEGEMRAYRLTEGIVLPVPQ